MTEWRGIYSRLLWQAISSYNNKELDRLDRILGMMNEVIFDEEAKKELNKKLDEISSEEKKKVELMNDIIKRTTHPHKRRNLYQSIKKIKDWRLEQTLKFHLFLSKKYSFLEGVKLSE